MAAMLSFVILGITLILLSLVWLFMASDVTRRIILRLALRAERKRVEVIAAEVRRQIIAGLRINSREEVDEARRFGIRAGMSQFPLAAGQYLRGDKTSAEALWELTQRPK